MTHKPTDKSFANCPENNVTQTNQNENLNSTPQDHCPLNNLTNAVRLKSLESIIIMHKPPFTITPRIMNFYRVQKIGAESSQRK